MAVVVAGRGGRRGTTLIERLAPGSRDAASYLRLASVSCRGGGSGVGLDAGGLQVK